MNLEYQNTKEDYIEVCTYVFKIRNIYLAFYYTIAALGIGAYYKFIVHWPNSAILKFYTYLFIIFPLFILIEVIYRNRKRKIYLKEVSGHEKYEFLEGNISLDSKSITFISNNSDKENKLHPIIYGNVFENENDKNDFIKKVNPNYKFL